MRPFRNQISVTESHNSFFLTGTLGPLAGNGVVDMRMPTWQGTDGLHALDPGRLGMRVETVALVIGWFYAKTLGCVR